DPLPNSGSCPTRRSSDLGKNRPNRRRETMTKLDDLDVALVRLLTEHPRLSTLECARRLEVARGTVTSRLARLHEAGVITGIVPQDRKSTRLNSSHVSIAY